MATIFGIGDANPPVEELTPPPKPPATPTPIPTPKPAEPTPAGALKRNVAFDVLRSRGISQVWEHKTKLAVTTFESAQRMKPKDVSVKLWLDVIEESARMKRAEMMAKAGGGQATLPDGTIINTGTTGAPGLPPVVPAGASTTPALKPPSVPPPSGRAANVPDVKADPRLVF